MSTTENLRKKIDQAKPISWKELGFVFNMTQTAVKKWIEMNCPQVEFHPEMRKMYFSPKEADAILNEWEAEK